MPLFCHLNLLPPGHITLNPTQPLAWSFLKPQEFPVSLSLMAIRSEMAAVVDGGQKGN